MWTLKRLSLLFFCTGVHLIYAQTGPTPADIKLDDLLCKQSLETVFHLMKEFHKFKEEECVPKEGKRISSLCELDKDVALELFKNFTTHKKTYCLKLSS